MPIYFHKENVRFALLRQEYLKECIDVALDHYGFEIETVNYIFCTDKYLLKLNKEFLGHDYLTDVITFNNSEEKEKLVADIFISIDRVQANAKKFGTGFGGELHRVMLHGALHLAGFKDKSKADKKEMRKAEDLWLARFKLQK